MSEFIPIATMKIYNKFSKCFAIGVMEHPPLRMEVPKLWNRILTHSVVLICRRLSAYDLRRLRSVNCLLIKENKQWVVF